MYLRAASKLGFIVERTHIISAQDSSVIVATFGSTDQFIGALEGLLEAGFESDQISVLGDHESITDRFGYVPPVKELADRPDAPRESLESRTTIDHVIDAISETVAVITEIGAATAAYAVGGPIGVATGASAATQLSVDDLLSEHIDEEWQQQLQQSVRDGGIVCWVHTNSAEQKSRAVGILRAGGSENIHETAGT